MHLKPANDNLTTFINIESITHIEMLSHREGRVRFNMFVTGGEKISSPTFPTQQAAYEWLASLQTKSAWKPDQCL